MMADLFFAVAWPAGYGPEARAEFAAGLGEDLQAYGVSLLGGFVATAFAVVIAYYGSMDPQALWEAGGATALFIAGFGAAGYVTRRDLTALARAS